MTDKLILGIARYVLIMLGGASLMGCAHVPPAATPGQISSLQAALLSLGPEVQTNEAATVAAVAFDYPRVLAQEYHLVRPPLWHNLLINLRLKERGLCYHWAEDLAMELESLELTSLELHWGVSRHGSWREHNTVVITASGRPFATGLVLDPWRQSGTLFWGTVTKDVYSWHERLLTDPTQLATNISKAAAR